MSHLLKTTLYEKPTGISMNMYIFSNTEENISIPILGIDGFLIIPLELMGRKYGAVIVYIFYILITDLLCSSGILLTVSAIHISSPERIIQTI